MHTYGILPEFRGGVHLFTLNHYTPSGQSRVYRVTQLRTDCVHCRESTSTGPVNLKVVPNECALAGDRAPINMRLSFSHTHYWYEVGMLKVLSDTEGTSGISQRRNAHITRATYENIWRCTSRSGLSLERKKNYGRTSDKTARKSNFNLH